jgi:hypothetical protein
MGNEFLSLPDEEVTFKGFESVPAEITQIDGPYQLLLK